MGSYDEKDSIVNAIGTNKYRTWHTLSSNIIPM